MIKFFRRIRRQLLSESSPRGSHHSGKLSRYLIYAFGEIILVVLGILIALQINNWNNTQKNQTEVSNYLINLRDALYADISSLEDNISFNKTRLRGIFYILEHSELNTRTFTKFNWIDVSENDAINSEWEGAFPDSINQKFTVLAFSLLGRGFGGVALNKSVINELYFTGSFSNIESDTLKSEIADYYAFMAKRFEGYAIEEHEEWANETTRFLRDRYGIFCLDVSDLEDPIAILKGKKDVEHHLRYLALEVNYHCIWASEAKTKAKNLVNIIDQMVQKK